MPKIDPVAKSSSYPQTNPEFSMEFLIRLIPTTFLGDRSELHEFICNCNNANDLASPEQKKPLLHFIMSQITGRAKQQLTNIAFLDWEHLKAKLKSSYTDQVSIHQIIDGSILSRIEWYESKTRRISCQLFPKTRNSQFKSYLFDKTRRRRPSGDSRKNKIHSGTNLNTLYLPFLPPYIPNVTLERYKRSKRGLHSSIRGRTNNRKSVFL
ncbi:hypothetical protein RUM43_015122 [Polyplax serrata]|uniref:Uncharacterized protein n=1 Tax=Polyplax serrata TaxID=468196 RepID=A0AAN8PSI9_POLSC